MSAAKSGRFVGGGSFGCGAAAIPIWWLMRLGESTGMLTR